MDHQLKKHHKNNPILSPFTQFYSSKKAIQIILSLSLFSFLFSQSSLLPLFFPTFSIKLFNYSTDRNYIFLLCNGILFAIIKSSGLFSNAPTDTEFRDDHVKKIVLSDESKNLKNYDIKKNDESHQSSVPADVLSETKTEIIEVDEAKGEISTKEESDENVISSSAHSEVENEDEEDQLLKIVKDEDGEEDLYHQLLNFIKDEDGEEDKEDQLLNFIKEKGDEFLDGKGKEEENEGLLSTEELNKKCDDFIRKMKDGIKIEAQHHITVYCQA